MVGQYGTSEPLDAVDQCSERFEELYGRIADRFARSETRHRVKRYLFGLLDRVERKNGWQLAEAAGETDPQGVQRLLNSADWDADAVRDDLREYVVEHLGDVENGVLIVDETGFLKKGEKSAGVARQYTGTAGDTVNCQVGVFLAYASDKGSAFIDRALYLPEEWANGPDRRAQAGVPREIVFESKIELAKKMLDRAFEAQVPAQWVVADSFYGRSGAFRGWLEERSQPYAVMMPKTNAVPLDGRKKKIEQLVERLPEDAYSEVTPAGDTGERRPWQWACIELSGDEDTGMSRWLLVRRGYEDPEDIAYWLAYGPPQTPTSELVRVCDGRWTIEECFSQAKGEVGLDQYEVRRWEAWHRYVTLCLLAHAFLTVTCLAAREEEDLRKKGDATDELIPLTVPEVRRLMLAMAELDERRRFRLGWSAYRRAHQAVAARCKKASRAAKRALRERESSEEHIGPEATAPPPEGAPLTDTEWEILEPLLPPRRFTGGRPYHDHRTVLGGILWVARTGSSWREMPRQFGKWETAYRRYELWVNHGLWPRILEALGEEDLPGPATNNAN